MNETVRAFIAIELSPAVRAELATLQKQLKASGADVTWVAPGNIHLTLKFLGNISSEQVAAVTALLETTARQFARFSFKLGTLGVFPREQSPRVIWVAVREPRGIIPKIVSILEDELNQIGFAKEERDFTPHITIGRVKSPLNKIHLIDKLKTVTVAEPVTQEVTALTLFKSTLTPQGPLYQPLAEISLKAN